MFKNDFRVFGLLYQEFFIKSNNLLEILMENKLSFNYELQMDENPSCTYVPRVAQTLHSPKSRIWPQYVDSTTPVFSLIFIKYNIENYILYHK
jgi:hypothetical protein